MELKSCSSSLVCRKAPSARFHPYANGSDFGKKEMREEVIRLGVELSVYVAEYIFFLCYDVRSLSVFCFKLWRYVLPYPNPVLERVFHVIHHVYSQDIKPAKGFYLNGDFEWILIRSTWRDFSRGIKTLHRLVLLLRRKDTTSFDHQPHIAQFEQQILKTIEDKFGSIRLVSKENGFVRETVKCDVLHFWKSLFDEEEEVRGNGIINDLFRCILGKSTNREIRALPISYPHIPGTDFAKRELKNEAVRFGVELSLYVAQTMFLLCDDVRSMLGFCLKLWRDKVPRDLDETSPVVERLLRVIHYVYTIGIKPKNGVFRNGGISVQFRLATSFYTSFEFGYTYLDLLVGNLRGEGNCFDVRIFTYNIKEELKKLEERSSPAKAVLEANGFTREAIEGGIIGLWKSLCDEEAEEATQTLKVIRNKILGEVFAPLLNE